jgi:curved DNA-binding protein CbpA
VPSDRDYYATLEVSPSADQREIEAAYSRLAARYGPDATIDDEAASRMKEIMDAFQVLRDPGRRAAYDRARATSTRQPAPARSRRAAQARKQGPTRAQRRRWKVHGQSPQAGPLSRQFAAAGLIGLGILAVLTAIILLSRGGDGTPAPLEAEGPVFSPSTADEMAIEALARKSIEVLPRGQWSILYDDFTADFQQRCPRDRFVDAGRQAEADLGADINLLRFRHLQEASVGGNSAQAVIVGEVAGRSQYKIEAHFRKVDGVWKIAPAPATAGCNAFRRLSN